MSQLAPIVMAPAEAKAAFPTTQWTAVIAALEHAATREREVLLTLLCRQYWYPLYAFARRSGSSPEDAEDLAQGFFAYAVEQNIFVSADRDLGTLRTFLLRVFQRYTWGIKDRENALKRGGGREVFSINAGDAEGLYERDAQDAHTPESLFDRAWAQSILRATLHELSGIEERAGRARQFARLRAFLSVEEVSGASYEAAARELGIAADAARQAVCRLRKKFGECLRAQIAATLQHPSDERITAELIALKAALCR